MATVEASRPPSLWILRRKPSTHIFQSLLSAADARGESWNCFRNSICRDLVLLCLNDCRLKCGAHLQDSLPRPYLRAKRNGRRKASKKPCRFSGARGFQSSSLLSSSLLHSVCECAATGSLPPPICSDFLSPQRAHAWLRREAHRLCRAPASARGCPTSVTSVVVGRKSTSGYS